MEASSKNTHSNVTHSDNDDKLLLAAEKSVGVTSSTLPFVTVQSSHHQPSNEGDKDYLQPGNEIRILGASSTGSSHRKQQQQQQEEDAGSHDDHSSQQNEQDGTNSGTKIQQKQQPHVSPLYILTQENHHDDTIDNGNEGGGAVATATTTCAITHDTTNVVGGDDLDYRKNHLSLPPPPLHTNTSTTAITSSSSTSPVLSAIINSVPNTTHVTTMMRNNSVDDDDDDSNNSHCDEYEDYDWSPPRHIYALREIIVEEVKEEEGGNALHHGEEGQLLDNVVVDTPRSESPPDDDVVKPLAAASTTTRRRTRLISSQMVSISGQENVQLGKISKGAVLCTQWKSSEDENDEEEWRTITKGEGQFNNIENASSNHRVHCTVSPEQQQEEVTVYTAVNKDDNDNVKEEHITVVPYPIARRRMGCNCQKKVEDPDDEDTAISNCTKRRPSLFKGVGTIFCRMVQRTLFCQLKRRERYYPNSSNNDNVKRDKVEMVEGYCNKCNFFGANPTPKQTNKENWSKRRRRRRRRRKSCKSLSFQNVGATIYGDEAVMGNTSEPINEILSINSSLGIYVCESGLTAIKCQEIIDAAESLAQHKGAWSAYTYAKQTLGCKEFDDLAEASEEPVMTACATIRDRLEQVWATASASSSGSSDDSGEKKKRDASLAQAVDRQPREGNVEEAKKPKKKLVLDTREPHVVKYDISRMERRKLDMHTDRSVWTFIIALSEGRGQDYAGGGTFFEQLNATVHLQRGQMIIFRGKLRHRGVKILYGRRYLLVGFLVEQKSGGDLKGPS